MKLALGLVVGMLAYDVMPDGPWYREIGAFALASYATSTIREWRSVRRSDSGDLLMRKWIVYLVKDPTGWWGIGVGYLPLDRDAHIVIGPWVLGIEHQLVSPEGGN